MAGALFLGAVGSATAADTAKVRVLHGSPDAPAVDVVVDGSKVFTAVPFGAISKCSAVRVNQPNRQCQTSRSVPGVLLQVVSRAIRLAISVAHSAAADAAYRETIVRERQPASVIRSVSFIPSASILWAYVRQNMWG